VTVLWTLTPAQIEAALRDHDLYESLLQWVRSNGIDPNYVSPRHPVTVEDIDGERVIRYTRQLRDEAGRKYLDGNDELAVVEDSARLLVDPPTLPASGGEPA
jgi:hypothetical protein